MKRRLGRATVLVATVTVLFFYPFLAPTAHRIDEAHLNLIRAGMTEAEVEGIFGVPAGEYDWAVCTTPGAWVGIMSYGVKDSGWNPNAQVRPRIVMLNVKEEAFLHGSWNDVGLGQTKTWTGRHGSFYVGFDRHGGVVSSGTAGEVRREYPWTRWWRELRGK